MKKYIILSFLIIATSKMLAPSFIDGVAVSSHQTLPPPKPYDGKTPPPLKLEEAYAKALNALGKETNQFYCISVTSLTNIHRWGTVENSYTGKLEKGWTFAFSSTNGAVRNVYVYFDKTFSPDIEDPAQVHQGFGH